MLSPYRSLKRSIMATDANSKKTITVTNNDTGAHFALSTISGSIGPEVIDIRDLYGKSGMFTFDPGFGATGSCLSGLTYIDGDTGVLLHCGYAIESWRKNLIFSKLLICCSRASYRMPSKKLNSTRQSPGIRWSMNSCRSFSEGSVAMRTRWRSCAAS